MLEKISFKVKEASKSIVNIDESLKEKILLDLSKSLIENKKEILKANDIDIKNAKEKGMKEALIDRLRLTSDRIDNMAKALEKIVKLPTPIGKTYYGKKLPNNLNLYKVCVPLGVVGVIYESRPNVTVDVFSLCFKTNNATILKGGSDAINSNIALVKIIKDVLKKNNLDENIIALIEDVKRETTLEFMKLNDYIDVLIPRGGATLIKSVINNSTIPVIETGTGNCHIYVDKDANFDMALKIIENAKTSRVGVCNACESLVIHKAICKEFIPKLVEVLKKHNVEIRGDELSRKYSNYIKEASSEDYAKEYLDLIISLKTVDNIIEAINHINKYSTKHSETIITENYARAKKFTNLIDSSCVYVNASTRFTDGECFGFGAEIGISTQKLHARGPMGLDELTTYKYIIEGEGQIR